MTTNAEIEFDALLRSLAVPPDGDWMQVKLREKGMAPHQLGFKMGIAAALINAWKDGFTRPKAHHIRDMVAILGSYRTPASSGRPNP